ncbi:MAG TPA: hypothetical protein EYP92_04540 [Candidatus Thioglobus sp.]|nr:hypothetical protein [Candidatus Thioglobus sp.]
MKETFVKVSLLISILSLTGCASSSVWTNYPDQAQEYRAVIVNNVDEDTENLLKSLANERDSADKILYTLERARVAQLTNNISESKLAFEQVIQDFNSADEEAKIKLRDGVSQFSAVVTNDNSIPYTGTAYDRIFSHHSQALNYWMEGDTEGAAVEFRRAAEEHSILLDVAKANEIDAMSTAEEKGFQESSDSFAKKMASKMAMAKIAENIRNTLENPYTYFTSGAFWESEGDFDDARIDYNKALELSPNNTLLQESIERVTNRQAMSNKGSVVILYEKGFVPAIHQNKYYLPTPYGVVAMALPVYKESNWASLSELGVSVKDDTVYTHGLTNFGALGVKHLDDKYDAVVARQGVRAVAKGAALFSARELSRRAPLAGAIAMASLSIYNVMSESADRRSWLTLPAHAQAVRIEMDTGENVLSLYKQKIRLNIRENKTTFVKFVVVSEQGKERIITNIFNGEGEVIVDDVSENSNKQEKE